MSAPAELIAAAVATDVTWLVDNADAYRALLVLVEGAERSIDITQLAFDADCRAYSGDGDAVGVSLLDALRAAAARGVRVRIVLNASLLLDTARSLRAALEKAGETRIQVRGMSRFPQLLHAKMVIVDESRAMLVGSPFVNGYWDDAQHRVSDTRRPLRELGGRPLHDLSIAVEGRVVEELRALFSEIWGACGTSRGRTALGIRQGRTMACTVPNDTLVSFPAGAQEILGALVQGIGRAREAIYIEHQYLSARPIVRALAQALERQPELEVIAVLNQNPDVTAYRVWQRDLLGASGLLDHPRMGLFTLWTAEQSADGSCAMNQVFVHSKVLVVDDEWACVGSANLDGVSLHSYGDDFASWLGRAVFRGVRNLDVNLVLDARDVGDVVIPGLRDQLWSEHLGVGCVAGRGALAAWRATAERNMAELRDASVALRAGTRVLPFSAAARPVAQLAELGITSGTRAVDLRFNPGWLEVHCSPNWIRNMFE
ncbi:MAG: hypothetical protein JWO05_1574 [Gemmatimonadetes bacterium]|nr:hypothetical protein [Gemmatimonadota bacterium]